MTDYKALCAEQLHELRGMFERILCVDRSTGGATVGDIQLAYRLINAVVSWSENSLAQPEPEGATDPELTPLEEHNRRKQLPLMGTRPSMPNGIACPNCGKELMDSNPDYALLTHPIQYRVHCPHCDWSGTRF